MPHAPHTLAAALWPDGTASPGVTGHRIAIRRAVLVIAGAAVLTLSSKIYVPLLPVPITMQTFAVLLIGMALGWRMGTASVLAFLGLGALGLPVFAGPAAGIGAFTGPAGGYLVGFLFAAALAGWLAEHGWDNSIPKACIALLAANGVIFAFGLAWLGVVIGWGAPVLEAGLYPFLWGEGFKMALAATLLPCAKYAAAKHAGDPA